MASDFRQDTVRLGALLSIADQIQAFNIARKTGEIRVINVDPPAYIALVDGEVVHAQFGTRKGLEAAIALINLRNPQTEFVVGHRSAERTIAISSLQVLVSAALHKDEVGMHIAPGPSYPTLQITVGSETESHLIVPGHHLIGRADDCKVVIKHPTVSKQHAVIINAPDAIRLRDMGSTNGTYVNGQRIEETVLEGRMSVYFGLVPAIFYGLPQN